MFRGVVAIVVFTGFAGGAAAFDANNYDAETAPAEALEYGLDSYRSGDKESAIEALSFAADKGNAIAQWKLGQMYAEGDGIAEDDYKAFELFSEMADAHADDIPGQPSSRFVSDAFVALGGYYRDGIPDTRVKQDLTRARQIYSYAASYFGDPEAQAKLAWMYYNGEGGERDSVQAARWAKLAADKGDVNAQALLGHVLFEGEGVPRQPVLGLMYLTVARDQASDSAEWIRDLQERAVSVATENERRTAMALAEDWRASKVRQGR
ncbi:tetratricopeptide repeat protein [Bauldia sp.]|uniref:tetratricopeptide repeat protein n=1 Tax=Bauldia sp. TaxID=2575872 RepID=UPI003BAD66B2